MPAMANRFVAWAAYGFARPPSIECDSDPRARRRADPAGAAEHAAMAIRVPVSAVILALLSISCLSGCASVLTLEDLPSRLNHTTAGRAKSNYLFPNASRAVMAWP